jgi:hypothetical protein
MSGRQKQAQAGRSIGHHCTARVRTAVPGQDNLCNRARQDNLCTTTTNRHWHH